MLPALSWDLYRTFLQVHRHGSLSGAARTLGLTQPTVGRHIDGLEAALGTALFTRSVSGLLPTATADSLVPHVEVMLAAAEALTREASRAAGATGGTIRIAASHVIGVEVLPEILAPLQTTWPDLTFELVLSSRLENLQRRDADLAVRMARPEGASLIARKIGDVPLGLFATQAYLERHGTPTKRSDLKRHRLIGFDRDDSVVRAVLGSKHPLQRADFSFRSDDDLAQLAAIRAGLGIGGMQLALAKRQSNLVAILPDQVRFSIDMWLVTHPDLVTTPIVRHVLDHLAQCLKAYLQSAT